MICDIRYISGDFFCLSNLFLSFSVSPGFESRRSSFLFFFCFFTLTHLCYPLFVAETRKRIETMSKIQKLYDDIPNVAGKVHLFLFFLLLLRLNLSFVWINYFIGGYCNWRKYWSWKNNLPGKYYFFFFFFNK